MRQSEQGTFTRIRPFDAARACLLEHFGVARRYMRPPQTSFSDSQMNEVKHFFDEQGLDPRNYQ